MPSILCLLSWVTEPTRRHPGLRGKGLSAFLCVPESTPKPLSPPTPPPPQSQASWELTGAHTPTLQPPSGSFSPTSRGIDPHFARFQEACPPSSMQPGTARRTYASGCLQTAEKLVCDSRDRAADGLASAPAVPSGLQERLLQSTPPHTSVSRPLSSKLTSLRPNFQMLRELTSHCVRLDPRWAGASVNGRYHEGGNTQSRASPPASHAPPQTPLLTPLVSVRTLDFQPQNPLTCCHKES